MTIAKAFLQERGNGKLDAETASLYRELTARNYEITLFTPKRLQRRQLPLDRNSFVAGEIPIVLSALKQIDIPLRKLDDYPSSLHSFLHRRIWKSPLRKLEEKLQQGTNKPIFAKPANRSKRFTGRVFESFHDLWYISGVSRQEEIWCSDVVSWLSEYRVYILHSQIVGIYSYGEKSDADLDEEIVKEAIQCLDDAGESVAGYALDFGVLSTGETALIEMNDGFSLRNYGLSDRIYTDLLIARWQELMERKGDR
ncbi:MAG: ATP-grasp domain-containing protein [Spirulina sp.]